MEAIAGLEASEARATHLAMELERREEELQRARDVTELQIY